MHAERAVVFAGSTALLAETMEDSNPTLAACRVSGEPIEVPPSLQHYTFEYGGGITYDLLPANTSKATAVSYIMSKAGIEAGEAATVGDSLPDKDMLEMPGARGIVVLNHRVDDSLFSPDLTRVAPEKLAELIRQLN